MVQSKNSLAEYEQVDYHHYVVYWIHITHSLLVVKSNQMVSCTSHQI